MDKTEHTQQCYFAQQLIADHFIFNLKNIPYKLVCWELMCEKKAFGINRNKAHNGAKKPSSWHASIDFILYSEKENQFIFIEMKDYSKPLSPQGILKAFLQTTYVSIKFKNNYDREKLYTAMTNCYLGATDREGGGFLRKKYNLHNSNKIKEHINLPKKNDFKINRYIMPFKFKKRYEDVKKTVDEYNNLNYNELKERINSFKKIEKINKKNDIAYFRFLNLINPETMNHFIENENPLEIFEIKNNYKNLISEYEKWTDNSSELIPKLKY